MSSNNASDSTGSSSGGNFAYDSNDSDFRTHYPVYGNSDYSTDASGISSIDSSAGVSDQYNNYASTDSGRSDSSLSNNQIVYNDDGSSATSYGSNSTWGSTIGRGSVDGYDGDTESINQ